FSFNEEGRQEAGLDEDFIQELKVCARSKGRTPNVFWFNPGAEESLVPGWRGADSPAAQQVGRDLALLPAYLARREDVVIVPEIPSTEFLRGLMEAGVELPELVAEHEIEGVADRKLHELRPWARTPDALPVIERLGQPCELTAPELFSKGTHAHFLANLLGRSESPILSGAGEVGRVVSSEEEVRGWLEETTAAECVLKAPFSTAGRERLIRRCADPPSPGELAWIEAVLDAQGCLVIEPWLERVLDFSLHYDFRREDGLRRRGQVVLTNRRQGQFGSATVADRITDFLDEPSRRSLFAGASRRGHLGEFIEDSLEPALVGLLEEHGYHGPLGVDAFLYRGKDGDLRFKPVVEINPRYTMGRVAIELARIRRFKTRATLTIAKASVPPPGGAIRLTPGNPKTRFAAYTDCQNSLPK
nr:hypothetical protein [Akkermansiaceae bacterium]